MKNTILIVEDDLDIQSYYEIALSDLKVEIIKANNGKEALEIIDSGKPISLIILDVVMPIMDGEEFMWELRLKRKLDIPLIISSADEISANKLIVIGKVDGIFYKLSDFDKLKELILKNLGNK